MKKLKLFSLALMALLATSMWAAEETFSFAWTSAGSAGYCYSANGPIGGVVLENNKVYFTSLNGPSKENERLNPYKTGFVFAPSTDVWMSFSATSGNSTNKNCSIRVEVIQNDYVWDAFVYSAGQAYPMPTCIFNHANGDTEELAWWKTNAGGKVITGDGSSKKPYAAGTDDASKKYMSGETASDGMAEAVFTTPICNIATKNTTESFDILNGTTKYIFESGKQYRLFVITSSGGFDLNSMTFTPAASYTITYNANGGEGEMENSTNTISACTFTAPDGYEFMEWNTAADGKGTSYAAGATATSDLDLYAIWQVHATSSDATLSALSVAGCTLSPAFASGTTAYTVALPFYASMPVVGDVTATKNDSYAKDPEVSIADNVISIACEAEDGTKKTYTVTVNIAEIPAASTSINIEQLVLDNSKSYSYTTALTAANISYANLNGLDSLAIGDADNSRPDYNESFLGLKIKKSGGYIQMVIPAGKTLKVKFGSVAADLKLTINEVSQTDISKSTSVYEHTATGNELIKIATSSDKTVVIKQIMIDEDIAVVRPFEATIAATTNGTASVELAKYAKGEEVTVNCVPASGYKLASIAVSGFDNKGVEKAVEVEGNKFTMPGSPVTITVTFSVATSLSNTSDAEKAQKRIENGQLVIEKNGQVFNAMGQTIR